MRPLQLAHFKLYLENAIELEAHRHGVFSGSTSPSLQWPRGATERLCGPLFGSVLIAVPGAKPPIKIGGQRRRRPDSTFDFKQRQSHAPQRGACDCQERIRQLVVFTPGSCPRQPAQTFIRDSTNDMGCHDRSGRRANRRGSVEKQPAPPS